MPGQLIYLPSKLSLGCRRARVFVQDYGVLHLPGKLRFCRFLVNYTLKYQRSHTCFSYCSYNLSLLFLNLPPSCHPPPCLLFSNWSLLIGAEDEQSLWRQGLNEITPLALWCCVSLGLRRRKSSADGLQKPTPAALTLLYPMHVGCGPAEHRCASLRPGNL